MHDGKGLGKHARGNEVSKLVGGEPVLSCSRFGVVQPSTQVVFSRPFARPPLGNGDVAMLGSKLVEGRDPVFPRDALGHTATDAPCHTERVEVALALVRQSAFLRLLAHHVNPLAEIVFPRTISSPGLRKSDITPLLLDDGKSGESLFIRNADVFTSTKGLRRARHGKESSVKRYSCNYERNNHANKGGREMRNV